MSNRTLIGLGIGGFLVLLCAAAWLLLRPPVGTAATAQALSGSSPALDLRYSYNPAVFRPAPYQAEAEFPLQLNAADWSFYGKRIGGIGSLLSKEPQPVVYRFIADANSSVYAEYYRIKLNGSQNFVEVRLGGKPAVRQELTLERTIDSLDWPAYFPASVTAGKTQNLLPLREQAERTFQLPEGVGTDSRNASEEGSTAGTPAASAWLYVWALFQDKDLYVFQAVAPRALSAQELALAEQIINGLEFGALRGGGPAAQSTDSAGPR